MNKNRIALICIGALFVLIGWLTHEVITGFINTAAIEYNPIAWQTDKIYQQGGTYLPILGKDYNLRSTYFNSKTWVVVYVTPMNNYSDPGYVVFKLVNGKYNPVYGIGNTIDQDTMNSWPSSVQNYLKAQGVVNG